MFVFLDYRPDGRRSSNEMRPTWPRQQNTTNPSNLKSFINPRPDREIKYQNRIPSQPLDNRPVLKYSTFHHSSPVKQTPSPAHKLPSSGDPIWLPRQHSSDSHGSSQSLSRTRGGLPGNCNNNNNNLSQASHSNTPSPQHQPYCRVGVSPNSDSPGVREPLLPKSQGENESLGHSDGGTTTSDSYVVDHKGLGSKDSTLRSNGTLILWWFKQSVKSLSVKFCRMLTVIICGYFIKHCFLYVLNDSDENTKCIRIISNPETTKCSRYMNLAF